MFEEIQWNDDDYISDLNDESIQDNQQDPIDIYLHACKQYQIRAFNQVIEGLQTNVLDLCEMSINDLDLKSICLALRVDIFVIRISFLYPWKS